MLITNESDLLQIVNDDDCMMRVLRTVRSLNLPDWWVCAGFLRSKIWDIQHGYSRNTTLPDVDVIYFYKNKDKTTDILIEKELHTLEPDIPWSVKNQARMHLKSGLPPYLSSVDAISKFPETVTSLGLKLDDDGQVLLTAPHGLEDAFNMEVQPTPLYREGKGLEVYKERVEKKKWKSKWPMVEVVYPDSL